MNALVVLTVLVGLSTAASVREKRQATCPDPFQNVPSPCVNNPSQRVYFPHPTDTTKFLQCDIYGRMYIIQCPQGEVYESTLTACRPARAAATNPPAVVVQTTQAPSGLTFNPCTPTALAAGQLYFAIVGDNTKFIECDLAGNPTVLSCPSQLLWDQGMQSCIYPVNANTGGTPPVTPSSNSLPGGLSNPCTPIALQNGVLFHPVPNDATKFIQCDLWGQAFLMDCPNGFVWNATYKVCVNPNINTSGKK